MKIRELTLKTSLVKKPVKLLHLTDQHITGADESDDDHARSEAERRKPVFYQEPLQAEKRFEQFLNYAEENDFDGIVMTGDIIDFPSKYNLKFISEKLGSLKIPFAYAVGNHDWCYADERACEDTKAIHFPEIEQAVGRNMRMDAIEIGGIIIATFDNALYKMKPEQTEFLRKQIETGKPVIAAFHVPMAVDTIIEPTVKVWGKTYLMNVSEELAKKYNCIYTIADAPTAEFCRLLAESENVIGVFAGHVHLNDCGEFGNGKTQIVSHIGVCDFATAVTFLPM
ncbi:MAG: hypothetical protein E7491_03000 [Ruminococcaceae bacterium]|nr:hypothetical protein [Oscillospiraceae bacterium]